MSSRTRMLTILDLYSEQAPTWTAEQMIARLECSKPTLYRYLRELCNAGLLLRLPGGLYALGPRVLALDELIRRVDPVMRVARPIMRDLIERTTGDVMLANVYGDQIMNVHREDSPTPAKISYGQGQPSPLFRGSTSKAILPYLPRRQLRRLYDLHRDDVQRAGLGETWDEFKATLAPIRRAGYVVSHGELDSHVVGIAAPVFKGAKEVLGSLTLILPRKRFESLDHKRVIDCLLVASRNITVEVTHLAGAR